MDFPDKRKKLMDFIDILSQAEDNNSHQDRYEDHLQSLSKQLNTAIRRTDTKNWVDEPDVKITEIEKQRTFFWIRIYLKEEDTILEKGDLLTLTYKPTNEQLELVFGGYEKEGLNRNYNEQVINFVSEDDKKILCIMIDIDRVNKNSEDIPTIRTMFRNSRHYTENLFYKSDIVITKGDFEYSYTSIGF